MKIYYDEDAQIETPANEMVRPACVRAWVRALCCVALRVS